ncbi:MAG: ribonuclease J [Solirubrobacterales bacterium]|nr:ribonuclease J [Solirubrobacterales bacterium]OJU95053.1 MAG: ribonuclease J [Solirubrobacterales bacterium 67-14]
MAAGNDRLKLLPLGGLGEIGKNMMVIEYRGSIVVVDTGLMFPTPEMLGIDLVLPDFEYLRDRADDIEAIVLTHGHEDHVGALPYVLREIGFPKVIYGGMLTVGMVRSKLDEHKLGAAPLTELPAGQKVNAGPFELELVHLSHSIPDMRGVIVGTDLGKIFMTGDYKFDQTPVDGRPADVARLAALGDEGLLLLCGDSTNADRPGVSPSESSVGPALYETFSRCKGRIIVTSFASNIHRVQQVIDAAARLDRKVALVGRSMRKNFNIASNLGMANAPDGMLIQPREIEDYPDERVVVISTGSQGEPFSALRRMANNDHRDVELHSGDTVVFSATPVPGNERAVNETIDRIYELGATVITPKDAPIHASGHGYREEIKMMLNLTRPKYVMPVHGDFQRIRLHSELAESVGVPSENIFRNHNGRALLVGPDGAELSDETAGGVIYVDGVELSDPNDATLRDRRTISEDGIVIVVATIAGDDGEVVSDPEMIARGVPGLEDDDELVDELHDLIEDSLERAAEAKVRETDLIQQDLHDAVAGFIYKRLKRRPMVVPVVVEV